MTIKNTRKYSAFALGFVCLCITLFSTKLFDAQAAEKPYEKDMLRFEKENADNPPTDETTFFCGSSTFTIWNEIPEDFKEYNAVNRGFGGSQISDWLNFACDRVLVQYAPRQIVFFCGCNDIAAGKTEEETFNNFKAFLNKMRDANPNLVLHFCALHMPPVREKNWEAFKKFNADVKALADLDPNIYYVDFAAATSDENGAGREELFQKDRLHLTREGEKKLIPIIKESLEKARAERAAKNAFTFPGPTKTTSKILDFSEEQIELIPSQTKPSTVDLGCWRIELSQDNDKLVLSLAPIKENENKEVFAQTKIAIDDINKIALWQAHDPNAQNVVNKSVCVRLKSGYNLIFSNYHDQYGFISIDYGVWKKGKCGSIAPVDWEFPFLKEKEFNELKALGSAGLKQVDNHKGSYAFLSITDPQTRKGVVSGWITSEIAGGVVLSGKAPSGLPYLTPQLDLGDYQNDRYFSERFVLGAFDDCRFGLENYAQAIADYYSIIPNNDALNGYCTWYSERHGRACDEISMKKLAGSIVENFADFGFQYVQIDDQWQQGNSKNGPNKNFTAHRVDGPYPSGMKATSDFLCDNNLIAGLWFMPFSGNYDDPYWADKQDLFVLSAIDYPEKGQKNTRRYSNINQKKGAPYETFWGGTALDVSNPKTRDYIKDVVQRITQDWNFKYIKIDGMWVGSALEQLYVNDEYLPEDMGKQIFFDRTQTNIENYRKGLELVRNTAKDTFILGCNVSQNMRSLASSYGLVDAMRIGPDNGADWNGVCAGPWRGTNRYFYNGRVWYNDPDPVYVRKSIPVERAQVSATWASISGQLYALSDWIPDYDQERVDIVRKTTPNHQCLNVRPVDLFDADLARAWLLTDERSGVRRDVLALFNWYGDDNETFEFSPEKLGLPLTHKNGKKVEQYVAYDFWTDRLVEPFNVVNASLAKESCKVLAIRPVENHPILLSTSRHVTQGVIDVQVEKWNEEDNTLTIVATIPPKFQYELRVYNPSTGKLDRWSAPENCVGVQTVEYKLNDSGEGTFAIVTK